MAYGSRGSWCTGQSAAEIETRTPATTAPSFILDLCLKDLRLIPGPPRRTPRRPDRGRSRRVHPRRAAVRSPGCRTPRRQPHGRRRRAILSHPGDWTHHGTDRPAATTTPEPARNLTQDTGSGRGPLGGMAPVIRRVPRPRSGLRHRQSRLGPRSAVRRSSPRLHPALPGRRSGCGTAGAAEGTGWRARRPRRGSGSCNRRAP